MNEIGIVIENDYEDDILMECVEDSITFIMVVAELEKKFDIEFPDEYLDFSLFESIKFLEGIINKIKKGFL